MNMKVLWVVIGLVVGALIGYVTRPEAAQLRLGGVSIEVQANRPAEGGGSLTSGQTEHIAIFAVIGAVIGLGIGFVADRRRA